MRIAIVLNFVILLCTFACVLHQEIILPIIKCVVGWFSPGWTSWNRFSESMLRTIEKKILQIVKTPYRGWFVDIGPLVSASDKIWTISLNTDSKNTPLVLLHGLGAGVALWCLNLDSFAQHRPVYAIDILGFGRSSRPAFSTDAMEAEQQIIRSIEEWRHEMKLDRFILLGHSMGGFLATSYALSHPERVKHLVLADPWGFPERPADYKKKDIPLWIRVIAYTLQPFNPLSGLRVAGPFGPWMVATLRPDISKKFTDALKDEELIPNYIYQCNAQTPSGETAFRSMMHGFGWAKYPMVNRIDKMDKSVPITLLYGAKSWIDHSASEIVKEKCPNSYVNIQAINGAGHHIYADRPAVFNEIVNEVCSFTDTGNYPNLKTTIGKRASDDDRDIEEVESDDELEKKTIPVPEEVQ